MSDVIEHLQSANHKMMDNTFKDRIQVFSFFLELYNELKKSYTLVEPGKETYASIYNSFLAVTPKDIYGISTNLSVCEYEHFVAKGCGSEYAEGCLYGMYNLIDDGFELTRLALEAACHYSVYCKEPLDIINVTASDLGHTKVKHEKLVTIKTPRGVDNLIAVTKSALQSSAKVQRKKVKSNGKAY